MATLDPQIQALEENLPGGLALPMGDPVEARVNFRDVNVNMASYQPAADLAAIEDLEVPGAAGPLAAKLYRPRADGPTATLVYFHGGGFVIGDVEAYDLQVRTLAENSGATVLSCDYRLAPEDPFPAGIDDAESITRWALDNVASLGGDPQRVAVGGDSAGGNLAAVTAQTLRDQTPGLSAQVLLYPVLDLDDEAEHYPSREENAAGPLLTRERIDWFNELYVPVGADRMNPRMSPGVAEDLTGLPPTILVTAGFDLLRDEGDHYGGRLAAAGVPVRHLRYESLIHGFCGFGPLSTGCAEAIAEIGDAVREQLAADPRATLSA
ncbi:MAG: alpha/beta hydrolase [Solirubrobacterales bacterium]